MKRLSKGEKIVFSHRNTILDSQQAAYYNDLFQRMLKIGTELEFASPKKVDVNELRRTLETLMKPSRDMENLGELGVFDVVKDHCGIEIQVIGRHPNWQPLLEQYNKIISILREKQVRVRPTCGLHFHLIVVGLAETIPEIILANLWNLIRRHAPGLKFLYSGGDTRDGICRRRQHNSHLEFIGLSPGYLEMAEIRDRLKDSLVVPEHSNFFNLEHLEFNETGDLKKFHLELRFPDGDLSPTSIVAKTFLFFAMVLKAVEISRYGLIQIGDPGEWERKKQLLDLLSNNDGDLARSNTSGIGIEEIQELRHNAMDLLIFLKPIFDTFANPVYPVLENLAYNPISLRRIEKDDWGDIENNLAAVTG